MYFYPYFLFCPQLFTLFSKNGRSRKSKAKTQKSYMGGSKGVGGGGGGPDPPEKSQKYRVYLQYWLKNHKYRVYLQYWSGSHEKSQSYQARFNVGPASTRKRNAISMDFRWRADSGPLIAVFGSSIPRGGGSLIFSYTLTRVIFWGSKF